jgi:outer membrane receptor protein involved in Fe transport
LLINGRIAPSDNLAIQIQSDLHSAIKGMPGMVTFPSLYAWQKDLRNITQVNLSILGLPVSALSFKTTLSHRYNKLEFSDRFGEQTGVPVDNTFVEFEPHIGQNVQYIWGEHQIVNFHALYQRTMLKDEGTQYDNPTRDLWAFALRDQIILWNERITLVPAIRYDSLSDTKGQISPKFGAHFRPVDWFVLKSNVGQSFRAPNFSELYFSQGLVESNPELTPERAFEFDAGFQIITKPFFAEAVYFRSEVDDLIEYLLISGFRYKPFNIGQVLIQGAEFSSTLEPWKYTSFSGSYTITYAIDQTGQPNRDGNQIPGRPRYQGFGRIEAGPTLIKLFSEYNYTGSNFVTAANTKLLDARHILNAGIVANPSDRVHFGFEIKNLLDDRALDIRGFPLPGRSVFGSIQVGF